MKSLLLALGLTACIVEEDHLELVTPRDSPPAIGADLVNVFDVQLVHCDGGNTHGDCQESWPTITYAAGEGYVDVTWYAGHRFHATNRGDGNGSAWIQTDDGLEATLDIEVVPVRYSRIGWANRDLSLGPFKIGAPSNSVEAAFTSSTIELQQAHYIVPFDVLAGLSTTDSDHYILSGYSDLTLSGSVSHPSLAPMPGWDASTSDPPFPRTLLRTDDVPGTMKVSTTVGGKLTVDVVDATAIASLGTFTGRPLDQYSFYLDEFHIEPRDANGRIIAGCPANNGPSVTDEKGLFVASRVDLDREPFCVLRFERVAGRALEPTTIVITWNGVELRLPFVPR